MLRWRAWGPACWKQEDLDSRSPSCCGRCNSCHKLGHEGFQLRGRSGEADLGENTMLVACFKGLKFWSHEETDQDVWKQRPFCYFGISWWTKNDGQLQLWSTYKAWNKGCAAHGPSAGDANGVWWHEPWPESALEPLQGWLGIQLPKGKMNQAWPLALSTSHIGRFHHITSYFHGICKPPTPPTSSQDPVLPFNWDDQES